MAPFRRIGAAAECRLLADMRTAPMATMHPSRLRAKEAQCLRRAFPALRE
jgi:hypothetical protein